MKKKKSTSEQGNRLRECLNDKKMSQKELSEKSGYTPQHINNIIGGTRNMSLKSAKVFSEILEVSETYLLCQDDYKTINDFFNELSVERDIVKKAALSLLKVYGISISEPFEKKLTGQELKDYMNFYSKLGLTPLNPHDLLVRVQVNKETPQEINANEIFEFVESIIEFAEFQAEKIKRKLDEFKSLSEICAKKAPDTN